ncbi:MAG: DUF2207 domain-containing protein, partial [Clostridia bacterium]|nr:DUF2207 domain-containing protein [Clostridia bacterium]
MKQYKTAGKGWAKRLLLALFAILFCVLLFPFGGGMYTVSADVVPTASRADAPCTVLYYTVNAQVNEDRTITFTEEISFTVHENKNAFYRALPIEGDRFLHITAEGVDNPHFSFDVKDNPDVDGFIDINCYGGLFRGETLTYRFAYTMECDFSNTEKGMIVDFVGGGWPFALSNVDVKISFPAALTDYTIYSSAFGESSNDYARVLEKTDTYLHLHADELPLCSSGYGRYAAPITVQFDLVDGGFLSASRQDFTRPTLWVGIVCGLVMLLVAAVLFFFSARKPVLSTVVGFTAPEGKDPMSVGYLLDGMIDNEDITSMIYYFASKGYLHIAQEDGEMVLIRKREFSLPDEESEHAKVLFEGLFKRGRTRTTVSDLKEEYYEDADKARILVGGTEKKTEMYQKLSVVRFVACAVLALGLFFLVPALTGLLYIGGGYVSFYGGLMMLFPVGVGSVLMFMLENYRYKWKKMKVLSWVIIAVAMLIAGLLYGAAYSHVMTGLEALFTALFGYAILLLNSRMLVRTEAHTETLGRILGFKEFILVTKKDRLEEMLEQNPELFYDILPYAQVLGVSDVWEEKFRAITVRPPSWYEGDYDLFDYWMFRRSMRMMGISILARPSSDGSSVGGSGGGGSFGGFSGGGGGG